MMRHVLVLGLTASACASMVRQHSFTASEGKANPIRKVVTMLQRMQSHVVEDGEKQAELFEKFMCYCKNSGGDLGKSITAAQEKIAALGSDLTAALAKKQQTEADLKEHTASRDDAKDTMATATALRNKEEAEFAKVNTDSNTNLAALDKAIPAIASGMGGSFLQTPAAMTVRSLAMEKAQLPDETRNGLLAFLSGSSGEGYVPQSGEIVGILKTIRDEMTASLSDASLDERNAIANFNQLMGAKQREVATLQKQIESESMRFGELSAKLAEDGNDLEDTQEALTEDRKFRKELETSCQTKTGEWEVIKKTRAEELLALAETIKVLNDDDALDLFKKTLPSSGVSLMQVLSGRASAQQRALASMLSARIASKKHRSDAQPELDLISLALRGKKIGFDKVVVMIDELVANLKKEQIGDDQKKVYCETQFDESDDKKKTLRNSIADSSSAIAAMEGNLEQLVEEIAALTAGVKSLDNSVAQATELRREENAEYKDLMTSDSTAKDLLKFAKNRLYKFYEPKMYQPPAKVELSGEDRIVVSLGGSIATTPPGGIADTGIGAFVQVSLHSQRKDAPPPPPETFGAYSKKTASGNGVIAMVDLLIKDLDKEMQEADVNEKDAQREYEVMMAESASKRATDSKSITDKSADKASTQDTLEVEQDAKASTGKELMGTMKYISALHGECDFLVKYFDARKQARADEVESLMNAKAVLSGADYA